MRFTLTIDLDNAAFDDAPMTELARILRRLAARAERGEDVTGALWDANGNRVGGSNFETEAL